MCEMQCYHNFLIQGCLASILFAHFLQRERPGCQAMPLRGVNVVVLITSPMTQINRLR